MSMATKKSQTKAQAQPAAAPQAGGSNSRDMWRWVYLAGGVVASLAGAFAFQHPILSWVLMLAGVLAGLFYIDTDDLTNFGVRYLLLAAVYGTLSTVPAVGSFITGFFGGFLAFNGPVALATLVKWFWNRHFARLFQ
jgi:hypothetical protein